jgi:fatty acid-binding protein DegV
MLDLRPILTIGKNGKIVPQEKVQGRKKALRLLADRTAELIEDPGNQTVIIIQADAEDDAGRLKDLILAKVPDIRDIMTIPVGPVVGTHCGPGTIASCFMGKERPL